VVSTQIDQDSVSIGTGRFSGGLPVTGHTDERHLDQVFSMASIAYEQIGRPEQRRAMGRNELIKFGTIRSC
jgi:hypothetical protein